MPGREKWDRQTEELMEALARRVALEGLHLYGVLTSVRDRALEKALKHYRTKQQVVLYLQISKDILYRYTSGYQKKYPKELE